MFFEGKSAMATDDEMRATRVTTTLRPTKKAYVRKKSSDYGDPYLRLRDIWRERTRR